MKWIFGFLVMVCIGLFAFMQWGSMLTGADKYRDMPGDLNAEKIRLLAMPVSKEMSARQAASPIELPAASASPASLVTVTVPASTPTPLPPSGVASQVLPAVAVSATTSPSKPIQPAVPPTVAPLKAGSKSCMEWGEFSGSDLVRAGQALAGLKLGDHLSSRNVEYASGYWVYIPPLANKAAVNKKIEEIKALGVDDYFVMRESRKWNNAISLGVFKTEEAAKRYWALMKKKGIRSAQLGERKHKLKFTVYALSQVDAALSARMAALQKEFVNSELKPVSCNK